ncbi:hypothetical protein BI308_18280 [Roseofilum reptotaenium AO1-A]|uniref:Uncharacterized protein n=1 Tax=Roseofilum reptotaenium AO1-A TaxID=1925591 RepID=A0A1L9QN78_9CYAN|nr:hypothetical protein BI308_18280 [Roseofilum reptotaenium AO1-A]
MYSAFDIAKYFITLASPEQEYFITNLKLQKLLYNGNNRQISQMTSLFLKEQSLVAKHCHFTLVIPFLFNLATNQSLIKQLAQSNLSLQDRLFYTPKVGTSVI